MGLFRRACGESLLKDTDNSENGVKFDPTLSLMLQMADQPVLMDVFKRVYAEKTKDLRRVDKKDPKFMKKHLEGLLKSTIWPVRTYNLFLNI